MRHVKLPAPKADPTTLAFRRALLLLEQLQEQAESTGRGWPSRWNEVVNGCREALNRPVPVEQVDLAALCSEDYEPRA